MNTFWRVEIEKGIKTISSMIVPAGQITDKKIDELLKILICKHMLNDEEVLSSFCKRGSKRHQDYFKYHRQTYQNDRFRVTYLAQMSSMSITITLIYEDELRETEKEKIAKSSSMKLYKTTNKTDK